MSLLFFRCCVPTRRTALSLVSFLHCLPFADTVTPPELVCDETLHIPIADQRHLSDGSSQLYRFFNWVIYRRVGVHAHVLILPQTTPFGLLTFLQHTLATS